MGSELVVRRESAAGTLDLLKAGEVEVAIAAEDNLEAQQWLERFPLFDEGFLLVCAREHRLANSASFGLDDLREERIVLPRHAEHSDALAASVRSGGRHDAWSDADMAALVAAGVGVAIAPRSFPRSDMLAAMPVEGLDLRQDGQRIRRSEQAAFHCRCDADQPAAGHRLGRGHGVIKRGTRPAWSRSSCACGSRDRRNAR